MIKNRKLKKIIKNPKLFIKDYFLKRKVKFSFFQKKNHTKYTIVSAVYGVEKYLEDFIRSVVGQSIGFQKNIELIFVDDGSLDRSKYIIKKWIEKYPKNIKYYYKNNGGQASARNLGLKYATGDWVTFIDPDDFIDFKYFESINSYILNESLVLISSNLLFYHERGNRVTDNHALSYKYKKGVKELAISELRKEIQLSASSSFFKLELIVKHNIVFSEKIKPHFEDAHFIANYLYYCESHSSILFNPLAKYYYRKRASLDSTVDTARFHKGRYSSVLINGYLDILKKYFEGKYIVPYWLQHKILYDVFWVIKYIIDDKDNLDFLTSEEKEYYIDLLVSVFTYIDKDTILSYNNAGCNLFYKMGMISLFKFEEIDFSYLYIVEVDSNSNLFRVSYFSNNPDFFCYISLDGNGVKPKFLKRIAHKFLDELFVYEYSFWLPFFDEIMFSSIEGKRTSVSYLNNTYSNKICNSFLKNYFLLSIKSFPRKVKKIRELSLSEKNLNKFKDCWLFIDRNIAADDNAEHLYRYVSSNIKDINIYFALSSKSKDWLRLKKEGFNLIDFNSTAYKAAVLNSKYLISSHADHYITDLFPDRYYKDLKKYKFVFLQHGVIIHDLSDWLNKKKIDIFITTTEDEKNSIIGDDYSYKYTEKEVYQYGLPRYDFLFKYKGVFDDKKKKILVMPTWRKGIVGNITKPGAKRNFISGFYDSDYFKNWEKFLLSNELKSMCEKNGAEVYFHPHFNVYDYFKKVDFPDHIIIAEDYSDVAIQKLLIESFVMITDYSSVVNDFAYLEKPVIYYQFDHDIIFKSGLVSKKGYFDYENHGYGPIAYDFYSLVNNLNIIFSLGADSKYIERSKKAFSNSLGRNREKITNLLRHI